MGWSQARTTKTGAQRFRAFYRDLRGQICGAGTYATEKAADKAWQRAESRVAEGRAGNPRRGRRKFRSYVEDDWLPNHVVEHSTRQSYTYVINKHVMPWFGPMRMVDILPMQVREWVTDLQAKKVSPASIRHCKQILSAIFTTALNDQVIFLHPCKGVKTPTVPVRPLRIITAAQFDTIYNALPDRTTRLLVETAIESGLRWGELTELRVVDVDLTTRLVTISRAVVQLNPKFHPDGGRFHVKDYPKDKESRRFKLSVQVTAKIKEYIKAEDLTAKDLLFSVDRIDSGPREAKTDTTESLGLTEPNSEGRQHRHGSLSGYSAGRCRCDHCRSAYATYRAGRRAAGKDSPRPARSPDSDGHIPRDWFRMQVWRRALKAAGIESNVRVHDLRHAHASWLLAGGASLQVVKERLGHASIATTEKYLHTLPEADETALTALAAIRRATA